MSTPSLPTVLTKAYNGESSALMMFDELQASMTMEKALEAENQLSGWKKQDKIGLMKSLAFVVMKTSNGFASSFRLSVQDASNIAANIMQDWWFLRVEEILYCFAQGQKGKYGKVSYGVDKTVLYNWLTIYDTQERNGQFCDTHDDWQSYQDSKQPPKDILKLSSKEDVLKWYQTTNCEKQERVEPENEKFDDTKIRNEIIQTLTELGCDYKTIADTTNNLIELYQSDKKQFIEKLKEITK